MWQAKLGLEKTWGATGRTQSGLLTPPLARPVMFKVYNMFLAVPPHTARTFPMMNKIKLPLAMLLLLQIVPAAQAAGRQHFNSSSAPFGYFRNDPAYDYARAVYGWISGPYPFHYTPGSHPRPLRSGNRCWANTGGGQLAWVPC